MTAKLLSSWPITLGGYPLTMVNSPDIPEDGPEPYPGYDGTFAPQEVTRTFVKRDAAVIHKRFSRGCGIVERRDENDDGGYAWAEDMMMWFGNGVMPSGRRVNVGTGYGLGATYTNAIVIDSVTFNGHLWAITSTGQCLRWPNSDPTQTPVADPALNAFGSATTSFRTGYLPKAIVVFSVVVATVITPCLVVSTYNSGTGATRMYSYTVAGGWTEGAADLGYRADKMATCFWEGRDGVGAERLHIQATDTVVRHCIQGNDPTAGASYITPLTVGNGGHAIWGLLAAPAHLYPLKKNGIHDTNELRAWNLTPYWEEQANNVVFPNAKLLYDDHLYAGRGYTLDRYDLRLGDGVQQRIPGTCHPMAFMQDGTPIVGWITALSQHDGWILASIYNPAKQASYVMRGKDRRILNVDIPNPIVWQGAEQAITSGDVLINRMHVTPISTGATSYLWMFASVGFSGVATADLYYAPLPNGSGPLSLQASSGTFSFNPTGRVYLSADTWDDRNASKGVHRIDGVGRTISATSTVQIKSRADGDPTTITDQATWTTQGTMTANTASITPASALTGQSVMLQSILTTPSPYTSPPILHEISPRAHVVREALEIRYIWVLLEKDYPLQDGTPDLRDMDAVWTAIAALQNQAAAQTFVDENGVTRSVYVEQGIQFGRRQVDDEAMGAPVWRTTARLELSLVA